MPRGLKQVFIAISTTGHSCIEHGIIRLAGSIRVDGVEMRRFDFSCQPAPSKQVTREALEYCGRDYDAIMAAKPYFQVRPQFLQLLGSYRNQLLKTDKYHLVCWDAGMVLSFLRGWVNAYMMADVYGESFFEGVIDVQSLAAEKLKKVRHKMKGFSMDEAMGMLPACTISIDDYREGDARCHALMMERMYDALTEQVTILNQ
jgi:hypothetical protein